MAELSNAEVSYVADGPGSIILSLRGDFDTATLSSVRESIEQILVDTAPATIAFDLSELTFMDSSGIALLLTIARQVDSVQLRNPSLIVRRVIELSGLETALPMTL